MPVFTIQTPEGKKLKIEAADEANAIRGAQEWSAQNTKPPSARPSAVPNGLALARARDASNPALANRGFFSGLSNSLTAPVNDEMAGGIQAAAQAVENGFGRLMGRQPQISAGEAYQAASEGERARQAAFDKAHPKASFGASMAGGFAIPAGGGTGLIAKLASIAIPGAAYGAAGTEGGLKERAGGAATGAGLSLATAGALKGASKLASPVVNSLVNRVVDRSAKLPPGAPPDVAVQTAREAARFVDRVAKSSGVDVRALTAGPMAGKPATAAEAIGRPGVTHLSALARRSGQTADVAEAKFSERAAQTGDRLLDDISNATGVHPEAARGSVDAIVDAGRQRAAPLFDAVLARPDPVMNPELQALAKRPVIQSALKSVAQDILNEGGNPQAVGLVVRGADPNGMPDMVEIRAPTAQTWDMVKKAVGRQVERNPVTNKPLPDSQSKGNYGVSVASRDLTAAMRKHIAGYGDALDASGEYLQLDGAFNRVKGRLFASKTTPKDFSALMGSFKTEGELNAARSALASDLYDRAQNGQLKPGALRVPAVRQKLELAFGKAKAAEIAKAIEAETMLSAYGGRIRPGNGSQTGELGAAMAEQDGASPLASVGLDVAQGLINRQSPLNATVGALGRQFIKAGATLKTPGMPVEVRDEAGRLLMLSPEELAAYMQTAVRPGMRNVPIGGGLLGSSVERARRPQP